MKVYYTKDCEWVTDSRLMAEFLKKTEMWDKYKAYRKHMKSDEISVMK